MLFVAVNHKACLVCGLGHPAAALMVQTATTVYHMQRHMHIHTQHLEIF